MNPAIPPPTGIVRWAPSPAGPWYFAVVTVPARQSISVAVLTPEARYVSPKEGARHVLDPEFVNLSDQEGGVWDYTESDKEAAGLRFEVAQLFEQFQALRLSVLATQEALGVAP